MTEQKQGLECFERIVVLMLENRSFDNIMGHLYDEGGAPRGQSFEGVAGKKLTNPIPPYIPVDDHSPVSLMSLADLKSPNPDPGEAYPHINVQLFGDFIPEKNWKKKVPSSKCGLIEYFLGEMRKPWNLPQQQPLQTPAMNGFVADYISSFHHYMKRLPSRDEYSIIMNCFPGNSIPVLQGLARNFGVFDHWFCSVPSQTWCNRAFFQAATSSGLVVNSPYIDWLENTAPTIMNHISEAEKKEVDWKVYFDPRSILPASLIINFPALKQYWPKHFCYMEQFYEDLNNEELPAYSFIEPCLLRDHNDMHPLTTKSGPLPTSNILLADKLIHSIYNAIRTKGDYSQDTAFMITFDEHGGCFDHVPPGSATPPEPDAPEGQLDFTFNRLGIRVPTVLVSSYVEPGSVFSEEYEHTSMIKTISNKWGIKGLTKRDMSPCVKDIRGAFNRSEPLHPSEWKEISLSQETPPDKWMDDDHPAHGMQKALAGLARTHAGLPETSLDTISQVEDAMSEAKKELFMV